MSYAPDHFPLTPGDDIYAIRREALQGQGRLNSATHLGRCGSCGESRWLQFTTDSEGDGAWVCAVCVEGVDAFNGRLEALIDEVDADRG